MSTIKTRLAKLELNKPVSKYDGLSRAEKLTMLKETILEINTHYTGGCYTWDGKEAARMGELLDMLCSLNDNDEMLNFVKTEAPALWAQYEFNK